MLQDMVPAAVNEAIRSAQELAAIEDERGRRRPGGPVAWAGSGYPALGGLAARAASLCRLFAAPVNRLITELARLPGIGQRTAQRLAFHILSASDEEALGAGRRHPRGQGDRRATARSASTSPPRPPAASARTSGARPATICVVEQPSDVIPIERSGEFHGRYHVLGGALSPIDGVDPEDLHIVELLGRVDNGAGVSEVVIATNATTTGEATALYLADALRERAPDVVVTRLASGLPVGSDLEYADEITLGPRAARSSGASSRCAGRMATRTWSAAPARTTVPTPARCT